MGRYQNRRQMKLSSGGRLLLEQLEGKRSTMYIDSAGHPTIGIGHLILPTEVWMKTATLTDAQIYDLLAKDIRRFEIAVSNAITVPLCESQFDALVIFAFNIGTGAFRDSTLVQRINSGASPDEIAYQWKRWNKAGGQVTQGLSNRRQAEVDLYLTGCEKKSEGSSSFTECSEPSPSSSSEA